VHLRRSVHALKCGGDAIGSVRDLDPSTSHALSNAPTNSRTSVENSVPPNSRLRYVQDSSGINGMASGAPVIDSGAAEWEKAVEGFDERMRYGGDFEYSLRAGMWSE
jgi:hypothetical protein